MKSKLKNSAAKTVLLIVIIILLLIMVGTIISELKQKNKTRLSLNKGLQMVLDDYRQQYAFPGATAAFVLPDGTIGVAASGSSDLESGSPMTTESRMLSASIGKTFVGAATVALVQEGRLSLDDPISKWLGDKKWFSRLPNHNLITIRHLLNHTSGLPDHVHQNNFASELSNKWTEKENPFTPEDLVGFVFDKPALFEPGKDWAYTDTGYILLGMILEEASGKSYYELIKKMFLKPLKLKDTEPANKRRLPGLASGYLADNDFGFPARSTTDNGKLAWHPGIEWAGGGLITTSRDLALWGAALFGGRARKGDYLKILLDAIPISQQTPDILYGSGIGIYRNKKYGPVYGHGGWIPGYISSLRYYPEYDVSIAFQINTDIGLQEDNVIGKLEESLAGTVISFLKKETKDSI